MNYMRFLYNTAVVRIGLYLMLATNLQQGLSVFAFDNLNLKNFIEQLCLTASTECFFF